MKIDKSIGFHHMLKLSLMTYDIISDFLRVTILSLVFLMLTVSCQKNKERPIPSGGSVLVPKTNKVVDETENENTSTNEETTLYPLVNLGSRYTVLGTYEGNLDFEQSDEQVLLVRPTLEGQKMELLVASTSTDKNEYGIVWQKELVSGFLTGVSLRIEDITGNGRMDMLVSGFNEDGNHVVEIFGMPKRGELPNYTAIFNLTIDGNIDIVTMERTDAYFSGREEGHPYRIIVQIRDPDSDNELDIIETEWVWNLKQFVFLQSTTRHIKVETLLEERLAKVYAGGAAVFEDYLNTPWYLEQDDGFNHLLYFEPQTREIMFYDGRTLEIFNWGTSHRTTAKRLYAKISNRVIPSISEIIWISAESWDTLYLTRSNKDWSGVFKRFNASLQTILGKNKELKSIMSEENFVGRWKDTGNQEIFFDLPQLEWRNGDNLRTGTAVLLDIQGATVLQVQFLKRNGTAGEVGNWLLDYKEQSDTARIIRSINLTPVITEATGLKIVGNDSLLFEQIELSDATQ